MPAVIWVSALKPSGTLDGARRATAVHQAWYAQHGDVVDRILFEPVIAVDPATHQPRIVLDQCAPLHLHATDVPPASRDAGWQAYIAAYDAQSSVVTTVLTCAP